MSTSIRSIRSIERSSAYTAVQAVSPYAFYPHRDGEPQKAPEDILDWQRICQKAASSAADWLQMVKQAQHNVDQLTVRLSKQLNSGKPIADSLDSLVQLLHQLESCYKKHADELKPELWASIELALRTPAAQELGLIRSTKNSKWSVDAAGQTGAKHKSRNESAAIDRRNEEKTDRTSLIPLPQSSHETYRMKRLLLGSVGVLSDLKLALSYAEQQKAIDLLQPPFGASLPYTAYYGAMQSYWPLSQVGLVLNRYL